MNRRVSASAIGKIIDALNVQRLGALLSLTADSSFFDASQSTKAERSLSYKRLLPDITEAESICSDLVRDTIVAAVEIDDGTTKKNAAKGEGINANALVPRAEIGSALEGRRLVHLNLDGTRLTASFNRSDLSHSSMCGVFVAHSSFNLSLMHGAYLAGGHFHSCTFFATDATNVDARRAHFAHCVFRRTDMRNWVATGATFFNCTFTMSDLSGWTVNSQTTVVEPVDWGRCRRLDWKMEEGSHVRECRVISAKAPHAPSLPPAQLPNRRV